MTNTPDTSPEAVERLAQMLETDASDQHAQPCEMTGLMPEDEYEAAATLRALSAALKACKARNVSAVEWVQEQHRCADQYAARAEAAEAERDALKAELAEAVEVTEKLCKEASITSNRGAVTGSHWTHLGMAILKTRAFIARHQKGAGA